MATLVLHLSSDAQPGGCHHRQRQINRCVPHARHYQYPPAGIRGGGGGACVCVFMYVCMLCSCAWRGCAKRGMWSVLNSSTRNDVRECSDARVPAGLPLQPAADLTQRLCQIKGVLGGVSERGVEKGLLRIIPPDVVLLVGSTVADIMRGGGPRGVPDQPQAAARAN